MKRKGKERKGKEREVTEFARRLRGIWYPWHRHAAGGLPGLILQGHWMASLKQRVRARTRQVKANGVRSAVQ
jgi:hypothetical protein